jgi:hypothetical protein
MDDREAQLRVAQILAEEASQPEGWWWLSFADAGEFRGVAIVRGRGIGTAVVESRRLQLNPGGRVVAVPLPGTAAAALDGYQTRLLTAEEALGARAQLEQTE